MPEEGKASSENQPETNLKKNSPLSRRRFLSRAATLALGGAASLSWLAACGETAPTPTSAPVTSGPTAPASTTVAAIAPTASPLPPTATIPATTAPTATAIPATATASAAPTATPVPAKPLNLVIFGDIRTAGLKPPDVYYKLVEQAAKDKPAAVLILGDIINAESTKATVAKQWANFREATQPLASARWLPTIGNHDTNFMDWAEPLYLEAFKPDKLPDNGPENYVGHAYSLDLGPVHLVSFASELPTHPHKIGKQQLAWLEKDLSSQTRPYTIVMSHDPAYPLGPHKGSSLDVYPDDRDALWKMFQKYKVSAYLCGHEHLYFRSQRNGVTQVIAGTSGSNLYLGYGGGEFQFYTRLIATDNGLSFKVIDPTGKERDSFNL